MFLLNDVKFNIYAQHTVEDIQYPARWFLDAAERDKLGIIEVDDIPQPDPELYDSIENPDGSWTSTPRDPAVIEAERRSRIPRSVTMRQARLALLSAGLLDQVNKVVAGMPGAEGEAARIEWEYSFEVDRDRVLIHSLTASLGLSEVDLDDLFTVASTL